MKRHGKTISLILFAAAAACLIWLAISSVISWHNYNPMSTSLPFHDIVLFKALIWVPLALILVIVGWVIRRRARRQG